MREHCVFLFPSCRLFNFSSILDRSCLLVWFSVLVARLRRVLLMLAGCTGPLLQDICLRRPFANKVQMSFERLLVFFSLWNSVRCFRRGRAAVNSVWLGFPPGGASCRSGGNDGNNPRLSISNQTLHRPRLCADKLDNLSRWRQREQRENQAKQPDRADESHDCSGRIGEALKLGFCWLPFLCLTIVLMLMRAAE